MPGIKKTKTKTKISKTPELKSKSPGKIAARGPRKIVARRRGGGDRGLGKILAGRSVDKIVPEVARRLEGGRRRHVANRVKAAEAELALLDAEAARIEKDGDPEGRKSARLARFRAAVAAEAQNARATVDAIERRIQPEPGGWSVIGRVVDRKGVPLKKARVVFVDEKKVPVKALTPIAVGKDGMARKSYPAATVAKMATARVRVAAAVRVGSKIVAVDETRTLVHAGRLHQFDLRVD